MTGYIVASIIVCIPLGCLFVWVFKKCFLEGGEDE
jgi:hypothetical protein